VRHGGEVEDGVDFVASHAAEDGVLVCNVSEDEGEVGGGVEALGVVQGGAVVDFVKADDVVHWICEGEVADDP
jgi:hypothetical protein